MKQYGSLSNGEYAGPRQGSRREPDPVTAAEDLRKTEGLQVLVDGKRTVRAHRQPRPAIDTSRNNVTRIESAADSHARHHKALLKQ